MIELLKSIKGNYDIFLINIDNKKYIVKIYNVDGEKQIRNSLYTQKKIYQSLKITADILLNKNNELYTKYNDKFYAIQEYIEEQKNTKIDIIEETSKNLYFLHQELKKLDKTLYKNKKEYSDSTFIIEYSFIGGQVYRSTEIEYINLLSNRRCRVSSVIY